jgi:NADH-quinone oxidoreductase subunit G
MIEIELDGKKVDIAQGSMIMHAAEKAGTYIPHFCYHKKLSIAASCRMCLVDVEKMPKPMPACATPVTQGMVVHTKTEKALKAQKSVMEFLLINHPLDCPICDQGESASCRIWQWVTAAVRRVTRKKSALSFIRMWVR